MITYIPHLITLVLCIGILVLASINLRLTCRNVQESLLRILIFMALSWQTVVILFFYVQPNTVGNQRARHYCRHSKLSSMAHVRLC